MFRAIKKHMRNTKFFNARYNGSYQVRKVNELGDGSFLVRRITFENLAPDFINIECDIKDVQLLKIGDRLTETICYDYYNAMYSLNYIKNQFCSLPFEPITDFANKIKDYTFYEYFNTEDSTKVIIESAEKQVANLAKLCGKYILLKTNFANTCEKYVIIKPYSFENIVFSSNAANTIRAKFLTTEKVFIVIYDGKKRFSLCYDPYSYYTNYEILGYTTDYSKIDSFIDSFESIFDSHGLNRIT